VRVATGLSAGLAALVAAYAPGAAADDLMSCAGGIVRVGMAVPEVAAKCGDPKTKQVDEVPVRVRHPNGTLGTAGVTRIERWTYERGYGQFPAFLSFEEGKLKSIELLTGR
jgi:hypothetical protein